MVNHIYKSKKIMKIIFKIIRNFWGLILILSIVLYFYLQPETKELIIVNSDSHTEIDVTEDDPRVSKVWEKGKRFILNNTNNILILESLSYSTYSSNQYTPQEIKITSGINPIDEQINFIFSTPPNTIRVKAGGTTTRWHLHR